MKIIITNSTKYQKAQKLDSRRRKILLDQYYGHEPGKDLVDIINESDSTIVTKGYYQGIMNESKDQFVAFFAYDADTTNLQKMGFEGTMMKSPKGRSQIFAYAVFGKSSGSGWEVNQNTKYYFNAKNLTAGRKGFFCKLSKWGFFRKKTTKKNEDFWEKDLFEK